ncbi:hypothetical protein [Actinoallomurus sp. CA-150999]|uniref:hypothetical protein n=1 Tax=Actinoallomurus sp. CA-150999 TaxID=3239887 RepID=UPI003D901695
MRDYRLYLLRDAVPKKSVRYSNNALAALDDFHTRLGLGKANIGRDDLPRTAPRALDERTQIRWLRAIEAPKQLLSATFWLVTRTRGEGRIASTSWPLTGDR